MQSLQIDPEHTALVVIDLQMGIVAGATEPHAPAAVVAQAARLADACRARGAFVVLVRVDVAPDRRDALRPIVDAPTPWTQGDRPHGHADIVPELGPKDGDHVVTKRQWGAFYGTDLDLQLRRRGIDTIILCGISTSIGVESTARSAFEHGYQQIFAEDAMAAREAVEHQHALTHVFNRMGRVRSTGEILDALG